MTAAARRAFSRAPPPPLAAALSKRDDLEIPVPGLMHGNPAHSRNRLGKLLARSRPPVTHYQHAALA
ncbi:hypothetical protein Msi02_53560 [Microbispora siamensis]|uniref:Uncharacterized protein n=1 Tax=Microbispora siamensis TaxID=564413 RepID=A0ABQ4GSY9_9ACTN|nr:hypothetical protein Msi02_53560 [Microbispora siamensis]